MKLFWLSLLITATAQAQQFGHTPHRDSLTDQLLAQLPHVQPHVFPEPMPRLRPNNSFYRHWSGPNQALRTTLLRATLDNMAIKQPDTTQTYTMLRVFPTDPTAGRWRQRSKKP